MAETHLHIDSAQKYGIVTGGPVVDVARCEELLARGKEKGITPAPDCVETFFRRMAGQRKVITALIVSSVLLLVKLMIHDHQFVLLRSAQRDLITAQRLNQGQLNFQSTNVVELYQRFLGMTTNQTWLLETTLAGLSNHNATIGRLSSNQNAIGLGFTFHLMRYEQDHPNEFYGRGSPRTERVSQR